MMAVATAASRPCQAVHERDPRWVILRFRRNHGQTTALNAGFAKAAGEVVITSDADLQNDPRDIPRLLAKMDEGHDIVSGWRKDRKEPFLTRRLPSMLANSLISRVTGVHLHDYGCTLKAYRSVVVKNIQLYGELHRFIPAVASQIGVQVTEIPVNDRPRVYGSSKYGISRTIRVLLDLITVRFILGYSTRPLQVFGGIGLLASGAGVLLGLILSAREAALERRHWQPAAAHSVGVADHLRRAAHQHRPGGGNHRAQLARAGRQDDLHPARHTGARRQPDEGGLKMRATVTPQRAAQLLQVEHDSVRELIDELQPDEMTRPDTVHHGFFADQHCSCQGSPRAPHRLRGAGAGSPAGLAARRAPPRSATSCAARRAASSCITAASLPAATTAWLRCWTSGSKSRPGSLTVSPP